MDRDEQNRAIARAIFRDIACYVDANPEAYARFLRKSRPSDGLAAQKTKEKKDVERSEHVHALPSA